MGSSRCENGFDETGASLWSSGCRNSLLKHEVPDRFVVDEFQLFLFVSVELVFVCMLLLVVMFIFEDL